MVIGDIEKKKQNKTQLIQKESSSVFLSQLIEMKT